MVDYQSDYKQAEEESAVLQEALPEEMAKFGELAQLMLAPGALDRKTKELIAVGIAVSVRCEGCIRGHVKNSLESGATFEELSEVVKVAILMGGGPSTAYGAKALSIAKYLQNK
ncbi:carboxymuconolactone decarboxylase family protein [Xylocopilactobacillus apicola]|uniref:Alkyl hydroperoxide reductase AhpD n=1 Tax=Xylocopilactobacillus apicola TaxID=2932184 RepID=A0AAU9DTB3_9LACO|nr:carboxymuconolactone decarboxylase family protein [Xylocopilactobacillus apicola]BDR59359.1 alkyl hydroperoxide reductase AhpD [Xylocopilactobacillus apicola]